MGHHPLLVVDALTKLADLRDRGALTDAEFQAEKQKLIGG
ncbi:MAG TPA: SHOCT domain-containing protein [Solirubrobacteraceae bacterium]|nr:SHOCT domain-containing protein [Solirubrobacteraceae bacterium]